MHNNHSFLFGTAIAAICSFAACSEQPLPYQNPDLSADERAQDLLGRLTLEQKVQLMMDVSEAIPELKIQKYNWWNEALHGAARSGMATVFPQAIGMAASFDPELLEKVFDIASTEQRIKYIEARQDSNVNRYKGLTVWTPNINIFRDPRWGRGQETYGEDPFLTTKMGYAVVSGLQGRPEDKIYKGAGHGSWRRYDKLHACLKHYAVHSGPESQRHYFDAKDISLRDLEETYLYAFENLVKTTDVHEVMCAYNAIDGDPCCGSDKYLTQILRNEWGYDGIVTSDCGAINDFYSPRYQNHQIYPNDAALSAANAVLSGTDVECGSAYKHLPEAIERGAIKEEDIDRSVFRLLRDRFRLGEMDDDAIVSWNKIPVSELASDASAEVALQMAHESMVLLQNKGNVLPLDASKKDLKIALIGPNAADSVVMWGNYNGTARHTTTVLEGLQNSLMPGQSVVYQMGSSHVVNSVYESCFGQCVAPNGKPGFQVKYYNNIKLSREQPLVLGEVAAESQLSSPWHLSTGGETAFEAGVDTRGFMGIYETRYHAVKNQDIVLDGFAAGFGMYIVNNDTINMFYTTHGARSQKVTVPMKAGKDYDIKLIFAQLEGDAQFDFNIGVMQPVDFKKMVADTRDADVYVYVGGISPLLEGEEMKVPYEGFAGGDRTSIELPKIQRETLRQLHKTGKPVVYVNMSGSAMGLVPELETCDAILQAWYGGQAGGQAVADVLFGKYNPSGKLPITFYESHKDLPDFGDYNFKGHTYRYFDGKVLFPFGFGLSYTTFKYGVPNYSDGKVKVTLSNTGKVAGTEIVQVYLKRDADIDGPIKALRGFRRVTLGAGESIEVEIPVEDLRTFNQESCKMELVPGSHTLYVGSSSDENDLQKLQITL